MMSEYDQRSIATEIKFLFPCVAFTEEVNEASGEITFCTETRVRSIYPIRYYVEGLVFKGDDFWGRPTFLDEEKGQYYCELDGAVYYKGDDMDGEPHWRVDKDLVVTFPDIDENLSLFQPCVDKVEDYFKKKGLNLVDITIKHQINENDMGISKIICFFKVKL